MKRLLSYSLVCLLLIVAFATINTYSNQPFSKENAGYTVSNTTDQYFLSAAELPTDSLANENLRVEIGLQTTVSLQNSQYYLFRMIHFKQIAQQNFISSRFFYSSHRTLIKMSGYYLFHLCKLLI